jgi:hypothetical protein
MIMDRYTREMNERLVGVACQEFIFFGIDFEYEDRCWFIACPWGWETADNVQELCEVARKVAEHFRIKRG